MADKGKRGFVLVVETPETESGFQVDTPQIFMVTDRFEAMTDKELRRYLGSLDGQIRDMSLSREVLLAEAKASKPSDPEGTALMMAEKAAAVQAELIPGRIVHVVPIILDLKATAKAERLERVKAQVTRAGA